MAANSKSTLEGVENTEDVNVTVSGEEGAADNLDEGNFIQYIGSATRRIITEADWESIGVKSGKDVEWSFKNEFKVNSKKFTKAQIKYLLQTDGRFQAVK